MGSVVCIGSILVASLMHSWITFIIFYGMLFPIGVGLLYWPPIICAWEWFPKRKGLVSGTITGAFGFGSFIFGFVTTAIVNPENKKREQDDITGEMFFS